MDGFVDTALGRIHYVQKGKGRPLVLLHSNGASCHEFHGCMDALAEKFRVLAWDMPGHGDSAPIARHMTISAYSDTLDQVLGELGIDSAIVGGSSVGAVIAADFAARYSARVEKVVLVELAVRPEQWWSDHWAMVEQMFSIPEQSAETIAARLVRTPSERVVRRWNIDRHKAGGHTMMDVMWAGREYDVEPVLRSIRVSALLVYGDKSPVSGPALQLKSELDRGAIAIVTDAGHFPMLDAPDAFSSALLQFA